MRYFYALLMLGLGLTGLAGCSPAAPQPPQDVIGPKQLATVIISPTPVQTLVIPPTATPVPQATRTRVPPTPRPSPTPYVGVFMGDGSAPIELPTEPLGALVQATLLAPTPLGGMPTAAFPTATPPGFAGLPAGMPVAGGSCTVEVAAALQGAYSQVQAALGCAVSPAETLFMAQQAFERGLMFWWSSGDIVALASQPVNSVPNLFWRVNDQWQEGMPADDPSMTIPAGLMQPVRGFGYAWRTNDAIRSAIGWALREEGGYTGTVQRFEAGYLFTAQDGSAYALVASDPSLSAGQYTGPL